MKKKTKKVGGKTLALAAFKLWLKKAPKVNYAITHSKPNSFEKSIADNICFT